MAQLQRTEHTSTTPAAGVRLLGGPIGQFLLRDAIGRPRSERSPGPATCRLARH